MSEANADPPRQVRRGEYWVVADASGVAFSPVKTEPTEPPPAVWAILADGSRIEAIDGRFTPALPPGTKIVVAGSTVHVVRVPALDRNVLWSHHGEPLLERMHICPSYGLHSSAHEMTVNLVGVIAGSPGSVSADFYFDETWHPAHWSVHLNTGTGPTTVSRDEGSAGISLATKRDSTIEREPLALEGTGFVVWEGGVASHLAMLRSNQQGNRMQFEAETLRITLGNAQMKPGRRRYERMDERRWRFEDLETNGSAGLLEIDVDDVVVQEVGKSTLVETRHPSRR